MFALSNAEWVLTALVFVWSGFVRTGLGFGGAALALPLILLVKDEPLLWLPIFSIHLLFFSGLTLSRRFKQIDWKVLKWALLIIIVPKMAGVLGLLNLPSYILVYIIYTITFIYGLTYVFDYQFKSNNKTLDYLLLMLGGYASGTSLIGAPLISAVLARHVALERLRDTLFALWILLVLIKVSAFVLTDTPLNIYTAVLLIPAAGVGHYLGLIMHQRLLNNGGGRFRQVLGGVLALISVYGLWRTMIG